MPASRDERAVYFRADDISPLECLDAVYTRQVFAPHFHEEYVVNTLTAGAQSCGCHGSSHVAGVGALVLINPGETHTGAAAHAQGWAYCGMYPAASLLQRLACEMAGRAVTPYFRETVIVDPALSRELVGLHRLLREVADPLTRESALYTVFGQVLRRHMSVREQAPALAHTAVERARQILADRLAEPVSLQELAEAVGLSPWHLSRSFRQRFGLPPVAWRNQLRVARAKVWLAQGRAVSEVASQLGFADQPHLTRAFRATLGVTPGGYQRGLRGAAQPAG